MAFAIAADGVNGELSSFAIASDSSGLSSSLPRRFTTICARKENLVEAQQMKKSVLLARLLLQSNDGRDKILKVIQVNF